MSTSGMRKPASCTSLGVALGPQGGVGPLHTGHLGLLWCGFGWYTRKAAHAIPSCASLGVALPLPRILCSPRTPAVGRAAKTPLTALLPPCPPPRSQFVLTTDPGVGSMVEALQFIYASLFVELVAKNPLYSPGEPFL